MCKYCIRTDREGPLSWHGLQWCGNCTGQDARRGSTLGAGVRQPFRMSEARRNREKNWPIWAGAVCWSRKETRVRVNQGQGGHTMKADKYIRWLPRLRAMRGTPSNEGGDEQEQGLHTGGPPASASRGSEGWWRKTSPTCSRRGRGTPWYPPGHSSWPVSKHQSNPKAHKD